MWLADEKPRLDAIIEWANSNEGSVQRSKTGLTSIH